MVVPLPPHSTKQPGAADDGTAITAAEVFFTESPIVMRAKLRHGDVLESFELPLKEGSPKMTPTGGVPHPETFEAPLTTGRDLGWSHCHRGGSLVAHGAISRSEGGRTPAAERPPERRHADRMRDTLIMLCLELDRRKIPICSSYTNVTHPHVVTEFVDLSPGHPHVDHRFVPRWLLQGPSDHRVNQAPDAARSQHIN